MRDRNQMIIVTALCVVLLVVIAFASGVNMTPPITPKATPQGQAAPGTPMIPGGLPNQTPGNLTNQTPGNLTNQTPGNAQITKPVLTQSQKKAQKINNECLKMKNVEDSATIVAGNTCLVACKLSKNVKDATTEKKMIADKIKAMNQSIKTCMVSDSMDAMPRINNLFKSNNQSHINNEMKKIIKDVTPVTR